MKTSIEKMPDRIMGRSLEDKVIPTVCNLKNMLYKLKQVNGEYTQLDQWEKIAHGDGGFVHFETRSTRGNTWG